jgi:hypothetical protein
VRYLPDVGNGSAREARFDWQVFELSAGAGRGGGSVPGADRLSAGAYHLLRIGIDAKAEMQRRVRKLLFALPWPRKRRWPILVPARPLAAQAFHNQVMAATATTAGGTCTELGAEPRRGTANAAAKASPRSAGRPRPGSTEEASALATGAKLLGVDLTANSTSPGRRLSRLFASSFASRLCFHKKGLSWTSAAMVAAPLRQVRGFCRP